jgi:hypothetical protein
VDAVALVIGWSCTPISAGCSGASLVADAGAVAQHAVPQAPPPVVRFGHGEYFESDPGWETAGGWAEAAGSVCRLNTWYDNDATVASAPWALTAAHLRGRARAVTDGERSRKCDSLPAAAASRRKRT